MPEKFANSARKYAVNPPSKNYDDDFVSVEDLSEWLGVGGRSVYVYADRGIIKRNEQGLFPLKSSVASYIKHLREQAAGRSVGEDEEGEKLDPIREKALLNKAMRDGHLIKNAVMRGELIPVDDVEAVVGAAITAIRTRVLGMPAKAAPRVLGLTDIAEATELLAQECRDICAESASPEVLVDESKHRAQRRAGRRGLGIASAQDDGSSAEADG